MMVPQRWYGQNNPRLPRKIPIIGIGCSSFSSFFSSPSNAVDLTVETMSEDHPVVQGWVETIQYAVLVRGINLLDTAPWYGHGTSEVTIGYALDKILQKGCDEENNNRTVIVSATQNRKRVGNLPRDKLIINTKVGRYESQPIHQFDFSYDTTIMSVQRSIERMNCSYIDVIQLHDPEFAPNLSILIQDTIPALLECRRRGWARAIGLTGYPLEVQHQILVECQGNLRGDAVVFDQTLVYCHNNLHDMSLYNDRRFPPKTMYDEVNGDNEELISFADFCRQTNVNLMAAAPLSMGLLTSNGPPSWHPASESLQDVCSRAAVLCESNGVNIESIALLFALAQPEVGCTLLGMKNVEEVDAAANLAMRFDNINFDAIAQYTVGCQQRRNDGEAILDKILTNTEKEVLTILLDKNNGPFAEVISNGEYRWNWRNEVSKFWISVQEKSQKA